ncbi:MAG: response regulator transcription factor [Acidimicrobiales bacterium]
MKTVLVVDDDPDIRELIIWKLSQSGYATIAAANGEDALAAVRARRADLPDLVLLDWMMPKQAGIDVCRAIRQDPVTAHIPVVFLTAKAQQSEMERGFEAGADDYIVKPFSPREMLSRIEAVLARAEGAK